MADADDLRADDLRGGKEEKNVPARPDGQTGRSLEATAGRKKKTLHKRQRKVRESGRQVSSVISHRAAQSSESKYFFSMGSQAV